MSKGLLLDYLPDENIKAPIPEGKIWLYANTDSGKPQIKGKLASGEVITFDSGSGTGGGGGGESGSALEPYVIVEQDGELKAQKITIDGENVLPDGSAEELGEVGLFRTGMKEPGYAGEVVVTNTINFYQCVSVDTTSGTWSGYKWNYDPIANTYQLSNVVAEGLPIKGITPVVGNSYSQDTLLRVDKFWTNFPIPEDGLVLYIPMNSVATTAETGQALSMSGTLSTEVVSGIPCTYFNGSSWYTVEGGAINPGDYNGDFTESMWVKIHPDASGKFFMALTTADYNGDHNYFHIGLDFFGNGFFIGGTDNTSGTEHIGGAVVDTTKWHHVVYIHDSTSERMYVDGVFYGSCSYYRRPEWGWERYYGARAWDGFNRSNWNGWIAGVRSYNRALTEDEITALAKEFEPTE